MKPTLLAALVVLLPLHALAQSGEAGRPAPVTPAFASFHENVRVTGEPHLRLRQLAGARPARVWDVQQWAGLTLFNDAATNAQPLLFDLGAPSFSLVIAGRSGNVGPGTAFPATAMHIERTNGLAFVSVAEGNDPEPRDALRLTNNGAATFRLDNSAPAGTNWGFGQLASGNFFITSAGIAFNLDPNGNLTIAGALTQLSDRGSKQHVEPVDGRALSARLESLPLASWSYIGDGVRHVGPMAQDFHAAFGLGADDRHIAPADVASVSLAAAQCVREDVRRLESDVALLQLRLEHEDAALQALRARVARLKAGESAAGF